MTLEEILYHYGPSARAGHARSIYILTRILRLRTSLAGIS